MEVSEATVFQAIKFAVVKYAGRRRDRGGPEVVHALSVMALLMEAGEQRPEVLAAAVLHDIVEDTDTRLDEVRELFGDRVAALVDQLTMPRTTYSHYEDWTEAIIRRLKASSPEAQAIRLADRVDNLIHIKGGGIKSDLRSVQRSRLIMEEMPPTILPRLRLWGESIANSLASLIRARCEEGLP